MRAASEVEDPPAAVELPGEVHREKSALGGPGIGKPGITSSISLIALVVNVVANLVLIPRYGITGASAASLVSYSLNSFLLTAIASRLTRIPVIDFWMPRVSDGRYLVATTAGLVRRVAERSRASSGHRGA